MSTQQTSERYRAIRGFMGFEVIDRRGTEIDWFRTEAAAQYAARVLNEGRAMIDSHAPLGCKVMPV